LKLQDEQYAWDLISLYPQMIDALDPSELKPFAVKAASLLTVIACELGRRHEHTDHLVSHIALELLPCASAAKVFYDNVST